MCVERGGMERGRGGERKEGEGVESGGQGRALASEPAHITAARPGSRGYKLPSPLRHEKGCVYLGRPSWSPLSVPGTETTLSKPMAAPDIPL